MKLRFTISFEIELEHVDSTAEVVQELQDEETGEENLYHLVDHAMQDVPLELVSVEGV